VSVADQMGLFIFHWKKTTSTTFHDW